MEITALIITNIAAPIITAVVAWLLAKKKYYSEVDSNLINNMQQSLEFYKSLSDDNKARLEEVLRRNEQLEKEISELRTQVTTLTMNICMDLTCANRALQSKKKKTVKEDK